MKIDFVIPCHPKDTSTINLVVNGVKKHTNCNKIFIISPEDIGAQGTTHISDDEFSEHTKINDIKERWLKENSSMAHRSSWIFQQSLKIFAHRVIEGLTGDYVALDADTIFIRDVIFQHSIFQYSKAKEYHKPYLDTYAKMTKGAPTIGFSCISHHMCFSKFYIEEMIRWVENIHQRKFMSILLDSINYNLVSSYSEWDFYANYMLTENKEACFHRQLKWKDLDFIPKKEQMIEMSKEFDFVSAHLWKRNG